MILHGLLGPSLAPKNLATTLSWLHFRGVLALILLCAGNFFCLACPFMLVRQAARRFFTPRFTWPRALRNKWLSVALFVLILFTYELFDLWSSPWWTAWLIIGYFLSALIVDGLFTHASFCKFVCPIGQFNFVASTLSPFEVKVRDQEVCTRCMTKDCIRGRREPSSDLVVIRGCELALFQPRKVGNMDCTFCLDCVHACPHDNVGILSRLPGSELTSDALRSGIGYFSKRKDLAVLAIIFTFGALAQRIRDGEPRVRGRGLAGPKSSRPHRGSGSRRHLCGVSDRRTPAAPNERRLGRSQMGIRLEIATTNNSALFLRVGAARLWHVARPLRFSLSDRALYHHSRDTERRREPGSCISGRAALVLKGTAGKFGAGH